jgi:acyl-CoA hydrolase
MRPLAFSASEQHADADAVLDEPIRRVQELALRRDESSQGRSAADPDPRVQADHRRVADDVELVMDFTMVSVDSNGKPQPVPQFVPQNEAEETRYEAAKLRRELRKEIAERNLEIKSLRR